LYGGNESIARSGSAASLNLTATGTMALTSSGLGQISNGGAITMTAPPDQGGNADARSERRRSSRYDAG
jgi:hypothetical protein